MSETKKPQRGKEGDGVLVRFDGTGILEFWCRDQDEAEELYRAIRAAVPHDLFTRRAVTVEGVTFVEDCSTREG